MAQDNCFLKHKCKRYGTEVCSKTCYPYVLTHGNFGNGGLLATTGIPPAYQNCLMDNLPIEKENPAIYKAVKGYCDNILEKVKTGRGIYFYGNTGNGKTSTAITILNEYLIARIIEHVSGKTPITVNPVLFLRMSELQIQYNAQFRDVEKADKNLNRNFQSVVSKENIRWQFF